MRLKSLVILAFGMIVTGCNVFTDNSSLNEVFRPGIAIATPTPNDGPEGAILNGDSINVGSILAFVFQEGSGNTLYDISPAANNGTTNATWAFDSGENKTIQQFNVPSEASQAISIATNPAQWTGLSQVSAYFRVNIYNFVPADFMHFFQFTASLGGKLSISGLLKVLRGSHF